MPGYELPVVNNKIAMYEGEMGNINKSFIKNVLNSSLVFSQS